MLTKTMILLVLFSLFLPVLMAVDGELEFTPSNPSFGNPVNPMALNVVRPFGEPAPVRADAWSGFKLNYFDGTKKIDGPLVDKPRTGFFAELTNPLDFYDYYLTVGSTIGTAINFGTAIANIGGIFDWTAGSTHTKNVDKFFSTGLGRTFDAANWGNNICVKWLNKADSSRTITITGASGGVKNGAYLTAEKSDYFIIPGESDQKRYYFFNWYLAGPKKAGLKVDVKAYTANGQSKTLLPEIKELGLGEQWRSTLTNVSNNDYVKVCLEFHNQDLISYFDYFSFDNNKLCQRINQI